MYVEYYEEEEEEDKEEDERKKKKKKKCGGGGNVHRKIHSYHVEFLGQVRTHAWVPGYSVSLLDDNPECLLDKKWTQEGKRTYRVSHQCFSVSMAVKEARNFLSLGRSDRLRGCLFHLHRQPCPHHQHHPTSNQHQHHSTSNQHQHH
ncbi:hypothetical protein Ahia01_001028300, partial [Argonauta hians]